MILKFLDFEEKILIFNNNKFCSIVEDANEINNFKKSVDYKNLITFYEKINKK